MLMQKLYISKTSITPEVNFSPEENIFLISGISSPEDVRAMYYPVIEWVVAFVNEIIEGKYKPSSDTPTHLVLYKNFKEKSYLIGNVK